ncbi:MAG: carbonic anhydrase, partial [Burkholderiaceae bacterium]
MSNSIQSLFDHNREWASQMERERPDFFTRLGSQQQP